MHGSTLQPWIDRWLSGAVRRWHLRFPPALEARFERDTGADRGRQLAVLMLAFCLVYLAWDLCGLFSFIPARNRLLHAALVVPPELAAAYAFGRNLRAAVRELLASFLIVTSSLSLTTLYALGAWHNAAMANTGVILTILIGTLVLQVRVPFAMASTAIAVAVQIGGLLLGPALAPEVREEFIETTCVTAAIALFASWRQEREFRRTYLLGLKETLRRQELSADNRELDDLARRDPLTGLPNRRAFDGWLAGPMPGSASLNCISLIAIDIDHFKPYNDQYGHPAGDTCLRQVAACLREQLRDRTDLVARIGGEEFAVLLPGASASDAEQLAETLRAAVEEMAVPHLANGPLGCLTISAGVASAPWLGSVSARALIAQADAALYAAKIAGRNVVCVAEAEGREGKEGQGALPPAPKLRTSP